ncbi:GntR family transcriptional regulator [Desulfuromonas versatilis]|uniref:GntR family transcriptional regulator n=1 Tax=Desulfuromonas versatilis TaxID=2802975 RepID=A0ABM8HSR1_9BACT|nr:PLP-dependent aminotransferase family protein [Desulfuromonas versatilis]BCR03658.1 GntR family transcriptional regulator [Desulfuromonas versatilis]
MRTIVENNSGRTPLYEEVAQRIVFLVENGTFKPGERVPSLRTLSRQMQVSVNTVKEAYGYLEDRRVLEARPQSGYYVCPRLPAVPGDPDISEPELSPTGVSISEVVQMIMRDILNPRLIQLGAAIPNPELLPVDKLNRMLSAAARRHPGEAVSYAIPPGNERLRKQIARRMLLAGCALRPDDIIATTGCMEAVLLALRATCRPGATLAVESPVYYNFLQLIQDLGLRALEIPATPGEGMSLEALRYAMEQTRVDACMVISNFNNPLGGQMPDERKRELVELLAARDIPLIEDDIYGDLSFAGERPSVAKAYDQKGGVLLCSSFSKTLAPGYRVGWIAPGRYRAQVERLKMTLNIASASPTQLAVAEFLANGGYEHHLRTIRRDYAKRVAQMSEAIGRYFPAGTRVTRPKGGFSLWVELPEYVDTLALYPRAVKEGITIAPGPIFSASGKYANFIRVNAAFWSERTEGAVATLGRLAAAMQPAAKK